MSGEAAGQVIAPAALAQGPICPAADSRSIVGEDERHVAHLLHRKTFMMHLENVHAGAFNPACVRFSRGREEKELHSEPDQDSRSESDCMM
jgi:hypothetical protein